MRQAGQPDGEQRSDAALAATEDERTVRFPYHAAGYDPAWLMPYAMQVQLQQSWPHQYKDSCVLGFALHCYPGQAQREISFLPELLGHNVRRLVVILIQPRPEPCSRSTPNSTMIALNMSAFIILIAVFANFGPKCLRR